MTHFARLIIVVALACGGCANRLSVETADNLDFAGYRTWAWLPQELSLPPESSRSFDPSEATVDPELGVKLEKLLAQGLVERGYSQVEADQSPDIFVAFHISVTVKQQLRSRAHARETLHAFGGRGGNTYLFDRVSFVELVPYEDAHLTVRFRDPRDREVVWFAEQRREVQGEFEPHLEETLAELLAHVPPRPAGS